MSRRALEVGWPQAGQGPRSGQRQGARPSPPSLPPSPGPGDVFQKPYVSGEADAASRELTGSEDYLLLACDGFFDVVSPQEVAGLVRSHLAGPGGSGLHVAEALVAAARERGSHDNITVVVVFLRDPRDLLRPEPDAPWRS